MTAGVVYRHNLAASPEVLAHLLLCDKEFIPKLSERVALTDYSDKLVEHAERFEAWSSGELIGLLAAYANDPNSELAYISNVSVVSTWQGQRIAANLLERCIRFLATSGYKEVRLEVGAENTPALRLYKQCGFEASIRTEHTLQMWLSLK